MVHSDEELKPDPLHLYPINQNFFMFQFKSVFCPFSKMNHDRFRCVYAHNYQDFKRPETPFRKPFQCPDWDKNKEIHVYEEGCPRGFNCEFCHGWKELEYHSSIYKSQPCKLGNLCDRKEICSFLHDDDNNSISKHSGNGIDYFHPYPANYGYNA